MSHFTIEIGNVWSSIDSEDVIDKKLIREIEDEMSFVVPIYNRYIKKTIEVKETLFEKEQLRYPTGLYSFLEKILTKNKHTFDVIDKRIIPVEKAQMTLNSKKLRDYQEQVVNDALDAQRGVIKIATGGGKTVIAAAIVARLNLKTLFIVYSIDLLEQTADEFEKMFQIKVGRIGGGFCDIKQINVCTIQTLHSAFDLKCELEEEFEIKEKTDKKVLARKQEIRAVVEHAEVVINDECHRATCKTYVQTMQLMTRAHNIYALSATPYKDNTIDNVLTAYSGKQICNITASVLIDKGFLVQPKIYMLDPNNFDKYQFMKKTYKAVYDKYVVNNKNRNQMIVDCTQRLLDLSRTVLITVTHICHGVIINEMLNKAGITSVAFIQGECDKVLRKKLLNQIRAKELKVLIGSAVADEGVDLPALDSLILAGGGKSLIKSLQRIGRTLRPYPGKTEAIIIDFYDRLRYLSGHSTKRIRIYETEPKFQVFKEFDFKIK